MAVATNRITDASARFMNALVAMEPETENSGIYANKPGYHGTRAENDARTGSGTRDYSCRAPLDRLGPSDKAAAYDWTHRKAQRGDYSSMAKYGDRLEAAFRDRDPRLYGWREALGQTDTDKAAEGLDFQGWFTRVPDSSHEWHWHFSELRAFVESWINKLCFLSVLKGETLVAYLAAGGQLLEGANVGIADDLKVDCIPNRPWRSDAATNPTVTYGWYVQEMWDRVYRAETSSAKAVTELAAVKTELAEIKALVAAGGVDPAVIQAAVRDAIGDALKAGGAAVDPV